VIRRHDNDRSIGVVASNESCTQANAGSGIPPDWLTDNLFGRHQSLELGGGLAPMLFIGQNPSSIRRHLRCDSIDRFLEKRPVAAKREKLFRPRLAASRPEPRPSTASHYHGMQHFLFLTRNKTGREDCRKKAQKSQKKITSENNFLSNSSLFLVFFVHLVLFCG
jgi:hypothetical protein